MCHAVGRMKTRYMPWAVAAEILMNPRRDCTDIFILVVIARNDICPRFHMNAELLRFFD